MGCINFETHCKWKSEAESEPQKLQQSCVRPEFSDVSERPEETFCHSESWERPPADVGAKNYEIIIMIIIIIIAVPTSHRVKLKESKKEDKYLDLARERKKLWNMKVTIIPIVIGMLGTVTKGLVKGLEELETRASVETIETTALLSSARILRRFSGDLKRLTVTQTPVERRPSVNAWMKTLKGVK